MEAAYEQCHDSAVHPNTPINIHRSQAMQAMASCIRHATFYNKPDPGQLNTIFASIAADIFRTAQLIDDSLTWPHSSGGNELECRFVAIA